MSVSCNRTLSLLSPTFTDIAGVFPFSLVDEYTIGPLADGLDVTLDIWLADGELNQN